MLQLFEEEDSMGIRATAQFIAMKLCDLAAAITTGVGVLIGFLLVCGVVLLIATLIGIGFHFGKMKIDELAEDRRTKRNIKLAEQNIATIEIKPLPKQGIEVADQLVLAFLKKWVRQYPEADWDEILIRNELIHAQRENRAPRTFTTINEEPSD